MAPALIAAMTAKSGPKSSLPLVPAQLAGQRGDLAAALANPGRFAIEEKIDGHRGMLRLADGNITILNRHGRDEGKIKNAPDLARAARAWADASPALWGGTILDGELYGGSLSGTAHLLGSAGRTDTRLRYIVFDAPFLDGVDQRRLPWSKRRAMLEAIMRGAPAPFELSALLAPTRSVCSDIWARGGEGVVIKDRNAPYSSGDRSSWTKVKQAFTAEGVVLGFAEGRGENAGTFGSVRLGQYRGGKLVEVCAVSGMSDALRATLRRDLIVGQSVVEFKYRPIEGARERYTEPRWVRVRDDKEPVDCVWEES
jgi:bifunctional non-homologous end joining protein LigD